MSERPGHVVFGQRLYAIVSDRTPAQIAGVVGEEGSVDAAAATLNIDSDDVLAALDPLDVTSPSDEQSGGTLAVFKDVFGLFAGAAVLVYVLGGAVLFARLSFAHLPAEAVFGQLPREFLITVGVGQVLVPGLIVAALYAIARGLRIVKRDHGRKGWIVLVGAAWLIILMVAIVAIADWRRGGPPGFGDATTFWLLVVLALVVAVVGAGTVRRRYATGELRWVRGPAWLTLLVTYTFVAMVAAACAAATFPLLDARACVGASFAENGVLVGLSGNRIFLGEHGTIRPRIASLPAERVDELFVGPRASTAFCDPRGRGAAVTAAGWADRAQDDRAEARRAAGELRRARTVDAAATPARRLATAARDAGGSARTVADAASKADGSSNQLGVEADTVDRAGLAAESSASELLASIAVLDGTTDGTAPDLKQLRDLAAEAERRGESAANLATSLADEAFELAKSLNNGR